MCDDVRDSLPIFHSSLDSQSFKTLLDLVRVSLTLDLAFLVYQLAGLIRGGPGGHWRHYTILVHQVGQVIIILELFSPTGLLRLSLWTPKLASKILKRLVRQILLSLPLSDFLVYKSKTRHWLYMIHFDLRF